jgi:malonyl-CoA O-methyltransferase
MSNIHLPKQAIADSFSKAADSYDEFAFLQQEIASRTFERLAYMRVDPKTILDVGCGTGACSRELRDTFKKAKVSGIDLAEGMIAKAKQSQKLFNKIDYQVADVDALPYQDNQFDLIFSNLAIQWVPDLKQTFIELNRVLKPGGLLIFSTLGPDTLIELKQSWQAIDSDVHVNDFIDMHIVGDQVFNASFENTVMDRDVITLTYKTMVGLMRDLKGIGAHNINSERQKGLLGKNKFNALKGEYEKQRNSDGVLPATYEVIYGHAWKRDGKPQKDYHSYDVKLQQPKA